jgi:dimethylamine/trimethylamine dehydrogenase
VDRIGDALAPGAIVHATFSGHRYARELDGAAQTASYLRDAPFTSFAPANIDTPEERIA